VPTLDSTTKTLSFFTKTIKSLAKPEIKRSLA